MPKVLANDFKSGGKQVVRPAFFSSVNSFLIYAENVDEENGVVNV
jgi:hypothetical protein